MDSFIGDGIPVLAPRDQLDYLDQQTVELARAVTPLEAWNLIMQDPQPLLAVSFKIRDVISKPFGVQDIQGFSGQARADVKAGDRLDFFLIEAIDDQTLVLTARDRHLDNMTCLAVRGRSLSVTTTVRVHNLFGRAYMVPVGPAHKVIVKTMLKRLQRKLARA